MCVSTLLDARSNDFVTRPTVAGDPGVERDATTGQLLYRAPEAANSVRGRRRPYRATPRVGWYIRPASEPNEPEPHALTGATTL